MAFFSRSMLVLGLLPALMSGADTLVGCRNNNGSPVDWWVAIKAPSGDKFGYIDNNSAKNFSGGYEWTQGSDWAAPQGNALADTLQQLYNETIDVGYVMWNDEFPGGSVYSGDAHSKGVFGFSSSEGFLLVHSVPKFPSSPCASCPDGGQGYIGILIGQQIYGQSFLCISLLGTEVNKAATSYHTEGVWIYDAAVPSSLGMEGGALAELVRAGPYGSPALVAGAPLNVRGASLRSAGGQTFAIFAKQKTPPSDPNPIYENLVEPGLGSGMLWETWQNGPTSNNMPPICGPLFSFTVSVLALPGTPSWRVSKDHSKFGVTAPRAPCTCSQGQRQQFRMKVLRNNSVCIGDMNRQKSQNFRGGGTVCFLQNDAIWTAFFGIIASVECPSQPPPPPQASVPPLRGPPLLSPNVSSLHASS